MTKKMAVRGFREFTGMGNDTDIVVDIPPVPKNMYLLGELTGVTYRATRDCISEDYYHEFNDSLPLLCVDPVTKNLYVVGGDYTVTDHGIIG